MSTAENFEARVVASRGLSNNVRELVFERTDAREFQFLPGQWVNLVLPLPTGELKRAYSISSAPLGSSRFEIAVTRVTGGPASEFLHSLEEGSTLRAIGPQGLFTRLPEESAPSLFVATGTGVTPLRSMFHAALRAGTKTPLWLLFGARTEGDILYRAEFESLANLHAHVRYEVTLSQPDNGWGGLRGYVQNHLPALYGELKSRTRDVPHLYICGLQNMVGAVRELARNELGVDRKHVHTERYD